MGLGQAAGMTHGRSVRRGIEQFEGGGGAGQALPSQMQVAHGGVDMTVPEQTLNGVQIDAGSRWVAKLVTQGVDTGGVGES